MLLALNEIIDWQKIKTALKSICVSQYLKLPNRNENFSDDDREFSGNNRMSLASSPGPSPASALGAHSLVEGPGNIGRAEFQTRMLRR